LEGEDFWNKNRENIFRNNSGKLSNTVNPKIEKNS